MASAKSPDRHPAEGLPEEPLGAALRWLDGGVAVAMATVVGARGSAPRPLGSKLCVAEGGRLAGSVSGGCVEGAVIDHALRVLDGAPPATLAFGWGDETAWDVGLPCGGEIDVRIERWGSPTQIAWSRAAGAGRHVARLVDADGLERLIEAREELEPRLRRLWHQEGAHVDGGWFVDVVPAPPRLIVFGAVDVADHVLHHARALRWRSWLVDPRSHLLGPGRFQAADEVIAGWPDAAVARLPPLDCSTAVLVLSHQPHLDDAALRLALRSDAWYVGAMGSRSMQAARRERLLADGFGPVELERLRGPVGLDLGGRSPAEMALSIVSEMVAVRHRRDGGPLRAGSGSIRSPGALSPPPASPAVGVRR